MRPKTVPLFLLLTVIYWWLGFAWYQIKLDENILLFFNGNNNLALDLLHTFLSFWGRGDTITVILLLLFLIPSCRNLLYLKYIIMYGFITSVTTSGLKMYFNINRPMAKYIGLHHVPWLQNAFEFSFPSGHTLGAFSFFSFILMAFSIHQKWIHVIAFFICLGCGISRIYLGQHYMSDVLFGAALGTIIGTIIGYLAQDEFYKHNIGKL